MIALIAPNNNHPLDSVLLSRYESLPMSNPSIPLFNEELIIIPANELVSVDLQLVATVLNLKTYERIQNNIMSEARIQNNIMSENLPSILSRCPFIISRNKNLNIDIMSPVMLCDDTYYSIKVHMYNYSDCEITIPKHSHIFNIFVALPLHGSIKPIQFKFVQRDDCVFTQGGNLFENAHLINSQLINAHKNIFKIFTIFGSIHELYQPYDYISSIILYAPNDIVIQSEESITVQLEISVILEQIDPITSNVIGSLPFWTIGYTRLFKDKKIISNPYLHTHTSDLSIYQRRLKIELVNHTNEIVQILFGTPIAEMISSNFEAVSSEMV